VCAYTHMHTPTHTHSHLHNDCLFSFHYEVPTSWTKCKQGLFSAFSYKYPQILFLVEEQRTVIMQLRVRLVIWRHTSSSPVTHTANLSLSHTLTLACMHTVHDHIYSCKYSRTTCIHTNTYLHNFHGIVDTIIFLLFDMHPHIHTCMISSLLLLHRIFTISGWVCHKVSFP
jgi:hypothetical protein